MTLDLEDQIRGVLARQARALTPPDWHPSEVALPAPAGRPQRDRRPWWLATTAAALVLVGATAVALRPHSDGSQAASGAGGEPASPLRFETNQVVLQADTVVVYAGGRTFTPAGHAVDVHSDPGVPHRYTTLELEWIENQVPMRISIYFASDGADWWASEIRTYDGSAQGEWAEQHGEFFRTPLGSAFAGDAQLGPLTVNGLRLEAFRDDPRCAGTGDNAELPPKATGPGAPDPTGTSALTAGTVTADRRLMLSGASSEIDIAPGTSGYGYQVSLLDPVDCSVVPFDLAGVTIEATVADPGVYPGQVAVDGDGRIDLSHGSTPPKPGRTTLEVTARVIASGEIVDVLRVPLIIGG